MARDEMRDRGSSEGGGSHGRMDDEVAAAQKQAPKKEQSRKSTDKDTVITGLPQFDASGNGQLFQDLTKRYYVVTEHDVINIIIAYGSKYCIAIVAEDDDRFELQGFSLTTFRRTFMMPFRGEYIKMKEIE